MKTGTPETRSRFNVYLKDVETTLCVYWEHVNASVTKALHTSGYLAVFLSAIKLFSLFISFRFHSMFCLLKCFFTFLLDFIPYFVLLCFVLSDRISSDFVNAEIECLAIYSEYLSAHVWKLSETIYLNC